MFFKQVQLYTYDEAFNAQELNERLAKLAFKRCLPSHHFGRGWIEPVESAVGAEPIYARQVGQYIMICLQIEEKILPASVIRQQLSEKIIEIEKREDRKVRQKEKLALKDEVMFTLLPRAFTKLSKAYAYFDLTEKLLVVSTAATKKLEHFMSMLRKIMEDVEVVEVQKLSSVFTQWLKNQNMPREFSVLNRSLLQDPEHQARIIRIQHQDLYANTIQALLHDGFEAKQLALAFRDQVEFVLTDGLLLQAIKFSDDVMEQTKELGLESDAQRFDANFMIMAKTFSVLFAELKNAFGFSVALNEAIAA